MRIQKTPKNFLPLLAMALIAVAGACSSDSPTEPSRPPATPPGGGGGTTTFNVTVTASPATVTAGSTDPVVITVRAVRADNGQPAPDGTLAVVSAFEGFFGQPGGPQSVTIELINGNGQITFFPPADEEDSLVVRANVAGSSGQVTIRVEGTATFFVSHVEPPTGSPQGGDTVAIHGNGFEQPVRVLFGGTNATVQSVSPNRIVVRTPPSPGATNVSTTVAVSVTINVNEEEQATDSVAGAFTYTPGGGEVQVPTIFSITPTTGPNEGGTPVSIIGEGFQAPVQVRFRAPNGDFVEAQVLSVTGGRIEVLSPAATGFGSALRDQSVDIQVTNLNTGLTTTSAAAFRYGVQLQITGLQPDVVDAEAPALVTIFGSGFESPLQVLVGGVQQQVVSVTGTQVVFRPAPRAIDACGISTSTFPVIVRLLNTQAEATAPSPGLGFRSEVPQPVITSVNPNTGGPGGGQAVNIGGSGFDAPVRVLFGGAAATVNSVTPTQIGVSTPPLAGGLATESCTAAGGAQGTRTTSQSVNVQVENLDTGCQDVLSGGFTYTPPSTACVPNPACSDGLDNDGDSLIDGADPGCSGPTDTDETDP